jgi:hypothetical protein
MISDEIVVADLSDAVVVIEIEQGTEISVDDKTDAIDIIVSDAEQGPPGPAGSAPVIALIAATDLSGHRVVMASGPGQANYASSDRPSDALLIVGITTGAASNGSFVAVQTGGELIEPTWSWSPGPIYCGLNGALTQTAPSSGFIRVVGIAHSPTSILIEFGPTIVLG